MLFDERGQTAHGYLFIGGIVLLLMFLIYVFICEHKTDIEGNNMWHNAFKNAGLTQKQISNISHDDHMWYYKSASTCVGFSGDFSKNCYRYQNYCAGGDRYGDETLQAKSVKDAIDNGGEHPMCPLIYPGAD